LVTFSLATQRESNSGAEGARKALAAVTHWLTEETEPDLDI
jgi:hypothetical protein